MAIKQKLGDLLVKDGLIAESDLRTMLAQQRQHGGRLGEHLVRVGLCSEEQIARALARQLNLSFNDLSDPPAPAMGKLLARDKAIKFQALVMGNNPFATRLTVAFADPTDVKATMEVEKLVGRPIQVQAASALPAAQGHGVGVPQHRPARRGDQRVPGAPKGSDFEARSARTGLARARIVEGEALRPGQIDEGAVEQGRAGGVDRDAQPGALHDGVIRTGFRHEVEVPGESVAAARDHRDAQEPAAQLGVARARQHGVPGAIGQRQRHLARSACSSSSDSRVNASTQRGSNCVPAQREISARACAKVAALR